ncbi:MAG: arginase [Chloroflexi bacterium]|nr:MAG: arginase [Chloroflexota bacterium]
MSEDIFTLTDRPNPDVLYRRDDPNDPRLGEIVRTLPQDYHAASVVILGCPQDEGVRRNKGRVGAAAAPDYIRQYLYRLALGGLRQMPDTALFDLGNTRIQADLEATHNVHRRIVSQVISDGKLLLVLGGGNDISYPDCSGLADVVTDILAFNIDAHFDVRDDKPRNSGTPYRQLLTQGALLPSNFYEMAYHPFANSPTYIAYLQELGVNLYSLQRLRAIGIETVFRLILREQRASAIFWGFDMDAVRASDAPGVSAPNPIGLTGDELCAIASLAGADPRTRIVEISEVNPTYDIDGRTGRLAAVALYNMLSARFSSMLA